MKALWLSGCCLSTLLVSQAGYAQSNTSATNQAPGSVQEADQQSAANPNASPQTPAVADIIVTAQRRSERLQNVPIAISAASAARLESSGIQTTQDLSVITPGLTMPQASGFTQPHIRGVGSSSDGPGIEPPVATYIDGVYIASAPSSLLTLNNIERIEVLKGPQGTLFGRNATGGLIQVITKDPKQKTSGAIDLSYANYKDVTADAYVTSGLTDTLAADFAIRYEHQGDGWGTNLGTGNGIGKVNHDIAVRAKLLFQPSDETTIRLTLDYENRRSSQGVQHLGTQYPGAFNNAFFGGPYPQGGPYDINNDFDPVSSLKAGGASLQIDQRVGTLNLKSISAYRQSTFNFPLDLDLTPANLISLDGTAKGRQFSQELQLSPIDTGKLKWVLGFYYFYAKDQYDPLNIAFGPSLVSPVPFAPVNIIDDNAQRTDSLAGYAQATYEVLPNTNVTGGVRFTWEQKRVSGTETFAIGGVPVSTTPFPVPSAGIPTSIRFKRVNYRLALDHKFGQNILGYVSYNTGFKSGGYNLAVSDNAPYKPESINAAEIGLKMDLFDRRVRLNLSAFHYIYSNLQVGRYIAGTQSLYNGPRAKLYGFDVDGEFALARGLSTTFGMAYTHARFTSFPAADYVPLGGCVVTPNGFCSESATGNKLPFAPTTTFNLAGDYKTEMSFGQLAFNATYYHTASFFAGPDNIGRQKPYDLLNASITLSDRNNQFSVKVWGKNLTKTVYAVSMIEAIQGLVIGRGAPRTYGVTAGYKF